MTRQRSKTVSIDYSEFGNSVEQQMAEMYRQIRFNKDLNDDRSKDRDLIMNLVDTVCKLDTRVYKEQLKERIKFGKIDEVEKNYIQRGLSLGEVISELFNINEDDIRFFRSNQGELVMKVALAKQQKSLT